MATVRQEVLGSCNREAIKASLQEVKGAEVDDLTFPDDWMVWLDDGYVFCDKYNRNREAIHFIARLVERTQCEICDVSTHGDIPLQDRLAVETIRGPMEAERAGTVAREERVVGQRTGKELGSIAEHALHVVPQGMGAYSEGFLAGDPGGG